MNKTLILLFYYFTASALPITCILFLLSTKTPAALIIIRIIPRDIVRVRSCILVSRQTAPAEITMKVIRIGQRCFQVIYLRILIQMIKVVASAKRPERVVASPYDGIRKGRTVMMKIPNPKPVVLSTKLAPTASNSIRA